MTYYTQQIGYTIGMVVSLVATFMPSDLHWHTNMIGLISAITFAFAIAFNKKGS